MSLEILERLDITNPNLIAGHHKNIQYKMCIQILEDKFDYEKAQKQSEKEVKNVDNKKSITKSQHELSYKQYYLNSIFLMNNYIPTIVEISSKILNYCRDGELFFWTFSRKYL